MIKSLTQENIELMKKMLIAEGLLIMDNVEEQLEKEIQNTTAIALLDKIVNGQFKFTKDDQLKFTLNRKKTAKLLEIFESVSDVFMPTNKIDKILMARAITAHYLTTEGESPLFSMVITLNSMRLDAIKNEKNYTDEAVKKAQRIVEQNKIWAEVLIEAEKFLPSKFA